MLDGNSPHQQVVADQPPVAPPEQSLGTHDCRLLLPGEFEQAARRLPKLRGGHVIGVVAKALVP